MDTDEKKWPWIVERLYDFMKEGSVLIFVSTKNSAEELQVRLNNIPDYAGKGMYHQNVIMFPFLAKPIDLKYFSDQVPNIC